MRKITFLAAVAATLCTVACNKNMDTQINEVPNSAAQSEKDCLLTLTVKGSGVQTKNTYADQSSYIIIRSLQAIVFNNGYIDGYSRADRIEANGDDIGETIEVGETIRVNCSTGTREVFLVVNGPDLSEVETKTALLATTASLSSESTTGIVLIGSDTVDLLATSSATIDVHRLRSRVAIHKITRAFTSTTLAEKYFAVKRIYLVNVAGDTNLAATALPTTWFNKRAYASELSSITMDTVNRNLANNASLEQSYYYYAYPNLTEDDSYSETWSGRYTRLVIEVQIGNDTCYYPINIPMMESNKSYEIEELILTRFGSESPDRPVTTKDCTFEMNIVDWTVIPVSDAGKDDITI